MNKKIECNVIMDLLPSYVDDICSDESKAMVEEHIMNCKDCKAALESMKSDAALPVKMSTGVSVNEEKIMRDVSKKIKKDIRRRVLFYRIIAVLVIIALALAFLPLKSIPSDHLYVNYVTFYVDQCFDMEHLYKMDCYSYWDITHAYSDCPVVSESGNLEDGKYYVPFNGVPTIFFEEEWLKSHEAFTFVEVASDYCIENYKYHIEETDEGTIFVLDGAKTQYAYLSGDGMGDAEKDSPYSSVIATYLYLDFDNQGHSASVLLSVPLDGARVD